MMVVVSFYHMRTLLFNLIFLIILTDMTKVSNQPLMLGDSRHSQQQHGIFNVFFLFNPASLLRDY